MLAVTVYEDARAVDWRLCLVPKKDYAIIDTWYAMGMVAGRYGGSGRWPFSSGVDNSQWNMLAVTVYEDARAVDWRLCLVPKKDYAIIDTWYAMGMVGTGSKDIEVQDVSMIA